jgi:hypothetical protein
MGLPYRLRGPRKEFADCHRHFRFSVVHRCLLCRIACDRPVQPVFQIVTLCQFGAVLQLQNRCRLQALMFVRACLTDHTPRIPVETCKSRLQQAVAGVPACRGVNPCASLVLMVSDIEQKPFQMPNLAQSKTIQRMTRKIPIGIAFRPDEEKPWKRREFEEPDTD